MRLPREIAVMTLPNATLFPQSLLQLYIFEPRYRQMLADALHSHRMFLVAMRKPGSMRETPAPVAGLGLIRVSVEHRDGTSHVLLQGLARVRLEEALRYKPYRVQRITPLAAPPCDSVKSDALLARLRELLQERIALGLPFLLPAVPPGIGESGRGHNSPISAKQFMARLDSIASPAQAADLVSCAVLPGAPERQSILETVEVESRLQRLIHFLLVEIVNRRKANKP